MALVVRSFRMRTRSAVTVRRIPDQDAAIHCAVKLYCKEVDLCNAHIAFEFGSLSVIITTTEHPRFNVCLFRPFLPFESWLQRFANASGKAIVPCRFNQDAPDVRIAGLGEPAGTRTPLPQSAAPA